MAEALPPLPPLPALPSYPMVGTSLGYGVIIINSFDEIPAIKRKGTDVEMESFKKLFISIGLEPMIYHNLKKKEILAKLRLITKDDNLEQHSIFAIAISSHGAEEGLFGFDLIERLERKKKKESLEGLDDTVTLGELKDILGSKNCSMLTCKPKIILLNGWKEGAKDLISKADGSATNENFTTEAADFFTICSSFDNISCLSAEIPASVFPSTLCDILLNYKREPLNALMGALKGELKKKSKKVITLGGGKGSISINESCMPVTTLLYQLQLFGNNENPGSGGDEGKKDTS